MTNRALVEEAPVAITINDINYAVMLASPYDLDDFAFGYLYSEQVISDRRQIHDVEIMDLPLGVQLNVVLSNQQAHHFAQQQRTVKGASGCGVCGKEAMDHAFPPLPKLTPHPHLPMATIHRLKQELGQWQIHAQYSGALHAAFVIDESGKIIVCREDIGRHNAVDKVIGYAVRKPISCTGKSLLVTSRCSVEIVQKAIIAGFSSLISLASPTQLAAEYASNHNLHLIHIPKHAAPYPVVVTEAS